MRSFFGRKRKRRISQLSQPLTVKGLLEIFDVFYVCFDEPNKEANWQQIKTMLPKAKKVEGVVGFDRALKTCAKQSTTDFFFLIDGDNRLLPDRFTRPLIIENPRDHWVLSWSSLNTMNGLAYGNGGLKLWPKAVAERISSHENAGQNDDRTDYCFIADYYLVDDYVTETVINNTYKQAFRAGFREGVKMSLAWGKQVDLNKENFESELGRQNRERLKVWCEVGDDTINGCWSILGARLGLKKNVVEKFDYSLINSYQWIDDFLETEILPRLDVTHEQIVNLNWSREKLKIFLTEIATELNGIIPINIRNLSPVESLNFKKDFTNPSRDGLLGKNPRL